MKRFTDAQEKVPVGTECVDTKGRGDFESLSCVVCGLGGETVAVLL